MKTATVWSKSTRNSYWLLERSYPVTYIQSELGLEAEGVESAPTDIGRIYAYFAEGVDPNESSERS